MLTQCGTFSGSPSLSPIPDDIAACFDATIPPQLIPAKGSKTLSRKAAFAIIGAQDKLDLEKSECGRRLIKFYVAQKDVYDGKSSSNALGDLMGKLR